jgi:hypothetical protein
LAIHLALQPGHDLRHCHSVQLDTLTHEMVFSPDGPVDTEKQQSVKMLCVFRILDYLGVRRSGVNIYAGYVQCDHCGIYDSHPQWCELCRRPKELTGGAIRPRPELPEYRNRDVTGTKIPQVTFAPTVLRTGRKTVSRSARRVDNAATQNSNPY